MEYVLVAAPELDYFIIFLKLDAANDADVVAENVGHSSFESINNSHRLGHLPVSSFVVLPDLEADVTEDKE